MLFVSFSGCQGKNQIVNIDLEPFDFLSVAKYNNCEFTNILPEYSSEVSICFESRNSEKTLMIFSTPIQYINQYDILTPIDTRISNTKDFSLKQKNYVYQTSNCDITTYYPEYVNNEKGIIIKNSDAEYEFGIETNVDLFSKYSVISNFIDESRYGIIYKNAFGKNTMLQSYPTSLGSKNEVVISKRNDITKFDFWISLNDCSLRSEPGGYILIISNKKDEDGKEIITGIIQAPLLKDKNGGISLKSNLKIKENLKNRYLIEVELDKKFINDKSTTYPIVFDLSFEMRKEKQPDTQVYSAFPNLNTYLRNFAIIGNHTDYGDCRSYIRYQFLNGYNLKAEQIKSINYVTYNLTNNNTTMAFYKVDKDWCSLTSNWNTKIPFSKKITELDVKQGVTKFDITEIAKTFITDPTGELQRDGLLLKSENNEFDILLSADSSFFPVRTEIVFK